MYIVDGWRSKKANNEFPCLSGRTEYICLNRVLLIKIKRGFLRLASQLLLISQNGHILHNIVYLFYFYWDKLPLNLLYLALKSRKILKFSPLDIIFG